MLEETNPPPAVPQSGAATRILDRLGGLPASLVLATAIIVPLLLFAISAAQQWQAVRSETQERLEHARDLLGAHTIRVLQTQQQLAAAVRDRIAPQSDDAIAGSQDLQAYLHTLKAQFPEVRTIWVFDAEGRSLASSLAFPAPAVDIAGQPFFESLKDGRTPYAISMRYPRGPRRDMLFSIAFAVRGAQDAFRGAVVLDVDPDYFQRLYSEVPGGVFDLLRDDGAELVRLPDAEDAPLRLPADSFLMQQIRAQEHGTAEGPAGPDGQEVLLAFAKLGSFPLYISYGMDTQGIRAHWFRRMAQQALYFIPATLILAASAWFAVRSQRRLAAANAELARMNATLESNIAERTADLTRALADKDVLIQEVHHRVKNNMQVISSLVGLQTRMGDSAEQTTRRIQAMALVHELIYGSGTLEGLDLAHYVQRLCDTLRPLAPKRVLFELDLQQVRIPLEKAVPVALVLNEQIVNFLLYGFEPGEEGKLRVQLRREAESGARIDISHTGSRSGTPDKGEGLAGRLLEGLVAQIQGKVVRSEAENEPSFRLVFPLARLQRAAA